MALFKKVLLGLGVEKEVPRKKDRRKGDRRFDRNELKKPAVFGDLREKKDRRKKNRRSS